MASSFPLAGVRDDFNRAALGGDWTNPAFGAGFAGSITANQLSATGNTAIATVWKVGPDCEASYDLPTLPVSGAISLDLQCDSNASTVNCYQLQVTPSTSTVLIRRLASGAATTIGTGITRAIAAGDAIGFRVIGNTTVTFEFWLKPASTGRWTLIDTRSEARSAGVVPWAPGIVGLSLIDTTVRLDNLGAGEVPPAAADSLIQWNELGLSADFGPNPFVTDLVPVLPTVTILTPIASETITTNPYLVTAQITAALHHLQFEISADAGVTWTRLSAKNRQTPTQHYLNPWRFPNGNYQLRAKIYSGPAASTLLATSATISFTITMAAGTTRDYVAGTDLFSAAITAAADGDTIRLSGVFADETGSISVNKRVRIIRNPSAASMPTIGTRLRFRVNSGDGTYCEDVGFKGITTTTTDVSGKAVAFKRCDFTNSASAAGIGQQDGEQFTFDNLSVDSIYDACVFHDNGSWSDSTYSLDHVHGLYAQNSLRPYAVNCKFYGNTGRQFQLYPNCQEGTVYKCLGYKSNNLANFGGDQGMATAANLSAQLLGTDTSATFAAVPADWPSSGTLTITDGAKTEYVTYAGKTATTVTGLGSHTTFASASTCDVYTYSNYNTIERCIGGWTGNDGLGNRNSGSPMIYGFWGSAAPLGTPIRGSGNEVLENFLHDPATGGSQAGVYLDARTTPQDGGVTDAGGNLTGSSPGYSDAPNSNFLLAVGANAIGYGPDSIQPVFRALRVILQAASRASVY